MRLEDGDEMTTLRVEWEPDDKGTPPEVIDVPQEVYDAGIVDGGDSVSDWLSDTYGYLVRDWTAHDPLGGINNGPCGDFAPDTLGDDPRVCTTCFYAGIDHKGLTRPHIPGTDYYDGRDGSIEADDDDEDRIAAEDESWRDYLDWQRSLGARN